MENLTFSKSQFNQDIKALHINIFKEDNAGFFDALKTKSYYKIFTATQNGDIVAYCIITLLAQEAEIINIATLPKYRGNGVACGLLNYVINNTQADKFFLEVNVHNSAAIGLYTKCGFKQIAIRKNYYPTGDAMVMQLDKG